MGSTLTQKGDGPVRLQIKILAVTTAGAGALVVLAEPGFERVEVGNALTGSKRADLCAGRSAGTKARTRIAARNREFFFNGNSSFSKGRGAVRPQRPSSHPSHGLMKRGFRTR
jgi:hypothetical protein